jgi:hypothetical protein
MAKVETPTLSPPMLDMAAGYGLILLLAILGAWYAIRQWKDTPRLMLPLCWAVSHWVLLYAVRPVATPDFHWKPLFSFQRKMAEGLHMPLCVLAAVGLVMVVAPRLGSSAAETSADGETVAPAGVLPAGARSGPSGPGGRGGVGAGVLIALAVVLSMPSNALFVDDCLHNVATNNRDLVGYLQPPIYLRFPEVRAIERLADVASEDGVVMCSSLTGSHIPPTAGCLVFAGHWAETLQFGRKVDYIGQFLLPGRSAKVLRGAVAAIDADYVLYGPREAMLARQMMLASDNVPPDDPAKQFRETTQDFLLPIFEEDEVTLYQFRPEMAPREPARDPGRDLTIPETPEVPGS